MSENYNIDLISALDQKKSQKQLNSDIKQIEKVLNMLQLTGTFSKTTQRELNTYIKQLSAQLSTIKLKAEIDSKNIKSDISKALNNVSFKDIDALNIDENKTKLKVQKVVADAKSYVEKNPISIGINYENRRNKLDNDLTAYINRNSKIKESSVLLKESNNVRELISAINDKKSLSEATDSFRLFKSEVASTGCNSRSTSDKIKSMLGHVTKISSVFGVASVAVNSFTKSISELKEIDTLLTEISKANDKLSKSDLSKIGNDSFGIASQYGKKATNYLSGVQEASRAGYENAEAIAQLSVAAQGAGNMTDTLANKYIIATDKAYKFGGSVEKLTEVLDGSNYITNHNAVNMTELAESMSIVGSTAASFGVDVDETTAALGTMIATTQQSGSEVARAFKAILLNIRQVSDEEEGINAEGLTKYEKACNALNVKLKETKDGVLSLRDPMEVLKELSVEYNKLEESDVRRTDLLSSIGGKLRSTQLDALLRQWDTYETMLKQYADGTGSMAVEAEKTAESWEGRLNSLSNSFTSFVNTVTNKDAVLGGITFFDKMIQGAESFVDTFGTIPTVLTAVNTSLVAMRKDYGITKIWDKENQKFDIEGSIFGIDISKIKNLKKHYEDAAIAISDWNCELIKGKTDLDVFENACVKNSASLKEYLSTCSKDAPASLKGYRQYLESTGQAAEDLRLKTILLNTALTFLGSIAVQAVITGIVQAFDKFNETVVESKEKVDDINSKISDLKSQIEELNNLEYKSEFDNQKISQLERELELQEKILEIEQKRLYQNQIGTKFSDYFDKDSLVTKQNAEYDRNNKENYANLSKGYNTYESSLNDIDAELDSLQKKLNSEDLIGHDRFMTEGKITELTEKRNNLLEKQQTIEEQLTMNMGEYLENYQTAQEAVESGLLTGSDLEKAESMAEYWNQLYQDSANIVTNIQKMNGTYDNTNDLLEEKFGNISRDDLVSLSDDDKRIALSFDPDNIIGFEELQQKIAETKGDIEELNATELKTFDQTWADSFTSEDDAVKELGNNLLELAEQGRLTIETFNNADSTGYFKNLGISADEAVTKINKLVDESKQLSSMSSQISSMTDALGTKLSDGFVDADTLAGFDVEVRGLESWDRFQEVLGSTTSSYQECEEAANTLATEWVNSSNFLAQLTEQNKEYYITQLEAMGVVNAEEVALNALSEAKARAIIASYDLANATEEDIVAMLSEAQAAGITNAEIFKLVTTEQVFNNQGLNPKEKIEKLKELANAYGQTAIAARIANMEIGAEKGHTSIDYEKELASLENQINNAINNVQIDFSGATKSAKSAGKEAGKSYKDGLKEELSDLEGIISSLSKAIDDQKEVISSQKEVALESIESQISALKEERDARLAVIEAEKAQLEAQIKAIDKKIDAKQKEIDAINDAAKARQHEIDLQKAQFELERMQNQRTMLVYSEDRGMHYRADDSKIASAKEDVDAAKRQLAIDAIEKEIDLLEEQKDLLNEQIDLLDEQAESIKNFYDAQIKSLEKQKESTEKYFESLIKSIEGSKDKYQELLDIVDKAELSGKLKKLGIDEEALLNGSEEEFEKLKNAYLDVVFQVNEGNEEMLSSLRELSGYEGTAPTVLSDTTEKLGEMDKQLDDSTESMDKLSDSATSASKGTSAIATSMEELSTNAEGLPDNLTDINNALSDLPEAENISNITKAFTDMAKAIKDVADALGVGEEGTVGGLVGALQSLSEISLGEMGGDGQGGGTGIVSQFQALKTAVDDVTSAISGGGSSGGSGGDASNSSSPSMGSGASGEGASSLVGAIESFKSATDEALGSGGEEGSGSDGEGSGAIGQFGQLKKAVDEVSTAIGKGDSEGGKGEEDAANLIGAINNLGTTTEEILAGGGESNGESGGVIGKFEEFKNVIGEANEHVTGISEGLAAIDGQEVECTIRVNIETTGGLPAGIAGATGTALDTMNFNSAEYNAKYTGSGHYEGTAKVTGDWGVKQGGSTLVGELGQELVVFPNGRFKTVGDNGAEFVDIPKGSIVFNHLQTRELLSKGNLVGRGKALASGTALAQGNTNSTSYGSWIGADGHRYRDLQPGDRAYELQKAFEPLLNKWLSGEEEIISNAVFDGQKQFEKWTKEITNNTAISNVTNNKNVQPNISIGDINVTCPGVTSQEVMREVGDALGKHIGHLSQRALQEQPRRY